MIAPISVIVKPESALLSNSLGMPTFELGDDVASNVKALRRALGSAVRELSREDLAGMISAEHPERRQLNATTIGRWEGKESEPDLHSVRIMAKLAGVSLDQFAFGSGTGHVRRVAEPEPSPAYQAKPNAKNVLPPTKSVGGKGGRKRRAG